MHSYVLSFTKRAQPLVDIETLQREAEEQFDRQWEAGEIEGWEDTRQSKQAADGEGEGIWCAACEWSLSGFRNYAFHTRCLGQKMYSKQTVYDAHLTSKKHVKAAAKQAESGAPPLNPNGPSPSQIAASGQSSGNGTSNKSKHRTAALLTYLATKLLASLAPVLNDTKSNVERRFSLTAREREQELLEQSKPKPAPTPAAGTAEGAEEEEEEERIYNPLKLPLGWDGKPIPYWLYKLHGLGVEYRCEICSDHVYMGRLVLDFIGMLFDADRFSHRKNFDRHFQVR